MSRIGRKPIALPSGVAARVEGGRILVEGPKGKLSQEVFPEVEVKIDNGVIVLERKEQTPLHNQMHGLLRTLIANLVEGVTKGFSKTLEMKGVGYRAQVKGKDLILSVGFSHPVEIKAPEGIEFKVEESVRIIVSGIRKDQVGQVAATIRSIRKPEPYQGKGIYYVVDGELETIIRKEGKRAAAAVASAAG